MRITLEELKIRAKNAGFQYAYGGFDNTVKPPHLVAYCVETTNFFADGKVYIKKTPIKLDYTYLKKNLQEQNKIEDEILKDLTWKKSEEYFLSSENVWQVSYYFEI